MGVAREGMVRLHRFPPLVSNFFAEGSTVNVGGVMIIWRNRKQGEQRLRNGSQFIISSFLLILKKLRMEFLFYFINLYFTTIRIL